MIFSARKSGPGDMEKIVEGNAPFELAPAANSPPGRVKPYRRGVLLVHGLTDSPYFMRTLGGVFQENGFRVMAVLLPGHGTQPGDLLDVTWQEWARAVAWGADQIAAQCDELYLAGFSAGGALSIRHSLSDPRVRGLFLFAPALKISPSASRAHWHKAYSWLMPEAKWARLQPDEDLYKYESFPKNAAAQMYTLTQEVGEKRLLRRLNLPVFVAASASDTTTDTHAILDFMMGLPHAKTHLVLYTADGEDHTRGFPPEKIERINSAIPERRILSAAHTSIVLPPGDAYYGAAGAYVNCAHYYPREMEKYRACKCRAADAWHGEISPENLARGTVCRLMYNPNFAKLEVSMKRFISELD